MKGVEFGENELYICVKHGHATALTTTTGSKFANKFIKVKKSAPILDTIRSKHFQKDVCRPKLREAS